MAAPNPISISRPAVARAREAALLLDHALRALLLYPPGNPIASDAKARLLDALARFGQDFGTLTLEARGAELFCGGDSVHRDMPGAASLTAAMESDGLRAIAFAPGVEAAELDAFLDAARRRVRDPSGGESLAVSLWSAGLAHVSGEAVDEIETPDAAAREREFWSRAARGDGFVRGLSPARGAGAADAVKDGAPRGPADFAQAAADIGRLADLSGEEEAFEACRAEAAQFDPVGETLGVLLEIVAAEREPAEFETVCALLEGLYDGFVARAEFDGALRVLDAAAEAVAAEEVGPRGIRLREVRARAAGAAAVARLAAALDADPSADLAAAARLLESLPDASVHHLVASLGVLKRAPSRLLVCDVLVRRGLGRLDEIGHAVSDPRWFVARNAAMILGRVGGAKACGYLRTALLRAEEPVRREAVKALVALGDADALGVLRVALSDGSEQLRLRALDALVRGGRAEDAAPIDARVRSAGFLKEQPEEQARWLAALAGLRGDDALPTFRALIDRRRFLNWGARARLRPVAVAALAQSRGPRTRTYLLRLAEGREASLREPARRALAAIARREDR